MATPTPSSHFIVRGSRTAFDRLAAGASVDQCWRGVIANHDDACAALVYAARGGQVIAFVAADATVMDQFIDDLRLTAPVEFVDGHASGLGSTVTPEQGALLDLLASGSSIAEAAAALHVSPRTAARRLANARGALGVATTTEAVVAWRRR
jgi:DNA-binding NarL/FixJ family response regulator